MSKPDWKDAPEWANYLAMDADGEWCWYEYSPATGTDDGDYWHPLGGQYEHAGNQDAPKWKYTKEERP